jgi:hypothetical protein
MFVAVVARKGNKIVAGTYSLQCFDSNYNR